MELDLDAQEGEIGYLVAPAARGRGVASRAVGLLTRWGFDELGIERFELLIATENTASFGSRSAAATGSTACFGTPTSKKVVAPTRESGRGSQPTDHPVGSSG